MGGQTRPEHVRQQNQFVVVADRAIDPGGFAHETRRTDEFRMSITNLVLCEPTASKLVDQVLTSEAMVDDRGTAQTRCVEPGH